MSTETLHAKGLEIRPDAIFFDGKTIANFSIYKKSPAVYTLNNGNQEVSIRLEKRTLRRFRDTALIGGDFAFAGSRHQFELLMNFLDRVFAVKQLTAKTCNIQNIKNPETHYYGVKIFGLPYEIFVCDEKKLFCTKHKEKASKWVDATNDALAHSPNLIEKLKSRTYDQGLVISESWLTKQSNKE